LTANFILGAYIEDEYRVNNSIFKEAINKVDVDETNIKLFKLINIKQNYNTETCLNVKELDF